MTTNELADILEALKKSWKALLERLLKYLSKTKQER